MAHIMPAFDKFPNEGMMIGRMLAAYGELELMLCNCVNAVRDDFNMVFKAMFRPRGESQRVSIADAMGREPYEKIGFGTQFAEAVASVRYCLKIRNQYAHCYWTDNYGKELGFVELEDTADKNSVVANFYTIPTNPLDAPLLDKQEAFFVYARDCLLYLEDQALIQAGKRTSQQWPQAPKKVQPPPLCKP